MEERTDTVSFQDIMGDVRKATVGDLTFRRKKSVSFSHTTRVVFVPSLYEMTDAEMSATWYADEDSDVLQGDIVNTIKAMRKGINSPDVCSRGLEHMRSAQHLNERKFLKKSVMDAVLDVQERQRLSGGNGNDNFDPEEIARASMACSRVATDLALTLAAADESFVRRSIKRKTLPSCVHTAQQRMQRRAPKQADENELCFNVLEKALALSSAKGNKKGGASPTSTNNSKLLPRMSVEQQPKLVQGSQTAGGKALPPVSSINLIRNKMSSGLKDELMNGGNKSDLAMRNGMMGLRGMLRRNDNFVTTST